MSAQASSIRENIRRLQALLGDIDEEDCKILIQEYGSDCGGDEAMEEIAQTIFEVLETSSLESVSELVWSIKVSPCFRRVRRSSGSSTGSLWEGHDDSSTVDSWCLARSKSSNTNINKRGLLSTTAAAAAATASEEPNPDCHALPYSGTQHPIQILKTPKWADMTTLRLYLSSYLQDGDTRRLLHNVVDPNCPYELILMRGASGSGKSTLASILYVITERCKVCSADNYFTKRNGEYVFNKGALGEAHEACRLSCQAALQKGDNPIIIDNTNTTVEEMLPYVRLAVAHNYDIKIVEPKTEWKNCPSTLARKTVHGVPKRTIECQLERFENTTVNAMVEKVLKEEGLPEESYRPIQNDMEWGGVGGGEASNWIETATTPSTSCKPVPVVAIPMSRMLATPSPPPFTPGVATPMSPKLATPSPPPFTPVVKTQSLQGVPVGTSAKLTMVPSIKSLIGTPSRASRRPTSIMLSDLIPDLKDNSGGAKPRRSGKRHGGSSNRAISTRSSSSPKLDKIQPLVFEDPADLAFGTLCKHFPMVPRDEIEKLFYNHEGDVDACVLTLIEEGFDFVDSDDAPTTQEKPSVPNEVSPTATVQDEESTPTIDWSDNLNSIRDYMSGPTCSSGECSKLDFYEDDDNEARQGPTGSFIDSDSVSNASEAACESGGLFDIQLPISFGRQLLQAFGRPEDEGRELSQDELTVKLGADTAFEIYKALYANMHRADNETPTSPDWTLETGSNSSAPFEETPDDGQEDEFNSIAISLRQMELETMSEDPQLASIMSIESKLKSETEKSLQFYTAPFRNMAQNINFSRLKEEYPWLDGAIIDEVYCQCRLSMEMTRATLNEMYHRPPSSHPRSQTSVTQEEEQSSTLGISINNSPSNLNYNPNHVKAYSAEEIRKLQRKVESLEKEWMSKMTRMKEYKEKCQSRNRGDNQAKLYYITEAKKVQDSMRALVGEIQHYKAITQNAKHNNDQMLDLHGLECSVAMRVLKEFLRVKEEEFVGAGTSKMFLLIITGQGKHSKNGCPILEPAVRNYLAQGNYRFFSSRPGCFQVILTRSKLKLKR